MLLKTSFPYTGGFLCCPNKMVRFITEYQNKLKELEAQRTEQENFEIVGIVRSMCMTRDELMIFLRSGGNDAPPAENVYHEQEDMTNDEE